MLEAMRWSGVHLFNWNQMPNHFHFNVETPDGNLSEFMQRLLTRFAKYFNRAHRLIGHLFQGRYGARLIDQENHFKEIVRYVELNCYRLNKGKLAELGQWKWSSLRYYMLPRDEWPDGCRTAFQKVLDRFGNEPVVARKNLAVFLADGLEAGHWEDFYQVRDQRFVGDESFVERVKQQNEEPVRLNDRRALPNWRLPDLFARVEGLSQLSRDVLAGASQARKPGRWRRALAYVARRFYRIPLVEIGHILGRDATTISHMLQSLREGEDAIPEIKQLMESLHKEAESL